MGYDVSPKKIIFRIKTSFWFWALWHICPVCCVHLHPDFLIFWFPVCSGLWLISLINKIFRSDELHTKCFETVCCNHKLSEAKIRFYQLFVCHQQQGHRWCLLAFTGLLFPSPKETTFFYPRSAVDIILTHQAAFSLYHSRIKRSWFVVDLQWYNLPCTLKIALLPVIPNLGVRIPLKLIHNGNGALCYIFLQELGLLENVSFHISYYGLVVKIELFFYDNRQLPAH